MTHTDTHAHDQARAQYASIASMVAAIEMDWDRLQDLREEFNAHTDSDHGGEPFGDAQELAELEATAEGYDSQEEALEALQQDALEVSVRSGWHSPNEKADLEEFRILLCTGGPAVQIVGELDQYGEPERARIQYQDWGTPWMEYFGDEVQQDVLLNYCRHYLGGF